MELIYVYSILMVACAALLLLLLPHFFVRCFGIRVALKQHLT